MADPKKPRKGTKAYLQNQLKDMETVLASAMRQNSYLVRRSDLSGRLGKSFSGERDTYESFGYPQEVTYEHLLNFYEREGVATRACDLVSETTWMKEPVILEGRDTKLDVDDDPGPTQKAFNALAGDLGLWDLFEEADKSCGISRFALLFLGLPGKPDEPVEGNRQKLAYVNVHDEGNAEIDEGSIVKDTESERFGLPEYYNIEIDDTKVHRVRVHYTRVIHIQEGRAKRGYSRIYGVPRLEKVANRLYDIEKVVGGSSEAFWLLIYRGLALSAREGMSLPDPGTDEYEDLQDEIEEYMHGLRRYMRLVGMDVEDLGGQPVDASEQFDVLMTYIAGSLSEPKRILMGSERGELASSQDTANFYGHIETRRTKFAESRIFRPFVDRLGELGVLKVPQEYTVHWPSLFQLNDLEKAMLASNVANALNTATGGAPETIMPPAVFAERYLDYTPSPEDQAEIEEAKNKPDEANQEPIDITEEIAKLPDITPEQKQNLIEIYASNHEDQKLSWFAKLWKNVFG